MDSVLILDFGSQTTQLIGRRIRERGVYTEILPGDIDFEEADLKTTRGIIFSGSPESVYDNNSPKPDKRFFETGLPILGICYGLHLITEHFNGKVGAGESREYGRAKMVFTGTTELLHGIPDGFLSWMSHGDRVVHEPPGFTIRARSEHGIPALLEEPDKKIYGLQFHPEVTHCEHGSDLLENFAIRICGAAGTWNMETFLEQESKTIQERVGDRPVLLLISGGVDSSVTAAMLLTALKKDQVHLMYIDTGLMRKNETKEVRKALEDFGAKHLHVVNASNEFLGRLEGEEDPEIKRTIIGDSFITIQQREVERLGIPEAYLAQGTLYTDMIESGKGVGKKAHTIKSHHNVRSPLVEEKRKAGLIIEPLAFLYKDEVRKLGETLGLSKTLIGRHPFPGPGLAVRIPGAITREKCDILREADAIFTDELHKRKLYDRIWQAFCVLLPVRSVGVVGDARGYGRVVALRAIISHDGMTADVYPFEMSDLLEISSRITNEVSQVGRVVYDISSKPPATIEWE
ncbi:MAG: glutamine-hydrolyzing GMP synthase [Spirochaetales bacterium]|nr:glutamine-hydrolyzing GMP synthase [Spirochaetales bacterium]